MEIQSVTITGKFNESYNVGSKLYIESPGKCAMDEFIVHKIIKRTKQIGSNSAIDCYCVCDETGDCLVEINEGTNLRIEYRK